MLSIDVGAKEKSEARLYKFARHLIMPKEARQYFLQSSSRSYLKTCPATPVYCLGYERVYLPLFKVADTPFHTQAYHSSNKTCQ